MFTICREPVVLKVESLELMQVGNVLHCYLFDFVILVSGDKTQTVNTIKHYSVALMTLLNVHAYCQNMFRYYSPEHLMHEGILLLLPVVNKYNVTSSLGSHTSPHHSTTSTLLHK